MNRRASRRLFVRVAGVVVISLLCGRPAAVSQTNTSTSPPPDEPTYSVEYVVTITRERPTIARVRWNLAGIEEINRLRLRIDARRHRKFSGSGDVQVSGSEVLWFPRGPYAHLEYEVRLRHRRSRNKGYDSYATRDWVITRARDLIPQTRLDVATQIEPRPRSRARIKFRLPRAWKSAAAMEEPEPGVFRPYPRGRWIDTPRGWIALGRIDRVERNIAGVPVSLVAPAGSKFPRSSVLDLYEKTLPSLLDLLQAAPAQLLLVVGPDPMWRGGISGERSIFLHAERPLRTPDRTSPPLHEAFHVLAPFRAGSDARWLSEGLAEYYSLTLQSRAKLLDEETYRSGLRSFQRYGKWNVNLSADRSLEVTNNSAPFVLAAIDEWIRDRTDGSSGLDDVVRELARADEEKVTTASFLRVAKRVAGSDLTPFVQRHVYAGVPPKLKILGRADENGGSVDAEDNR